MLAEVAGSLSVLAFLAVRRAREKASECTDWCKLVRYFVKRRRNPIRFITHALLEEFGDREDYVKVRMFGLVGPFIIFARDEGLVTHVTGPAASRYVRANPLNASTFHGAGPFTSAVGMKCFLDGFLAKSIWFQPSGEVHDRQRELFLSFVAKFLTRPAQDSIYEVASQALRERVSAKGPGADLFDLLQEVVAVVQLRFISDYSLGGCSIEDFCRITNGAFGSMYDFRSPTPEQRRELSEICRDMLGRAGEEGFVQHMRKHASARLSEAELEEELRHNLMASLFLGQQALANAAFWMVLRLAQSPALLARLRAELEGQTRPKDPLLPKILTEELRMHPPSSPFLMPYVAKQPDSWGSALTIPRTSIVVVMPVLMHLNEKHWHAASCFDEERFAGRLAVRHAGSHTACAGPVPVSSVRGIMLQGASRRCPVTGAAPQKGEKQHQFCPFGAGSATCPMQGFSLSVILGLITHIACHWDVTVLDEAGLLGAPVEQHVVVDTGSRPLKRVRATFCRRP